MFITKDNVEFRQSILDTADTDCPTPPALARIIIPSGTTFFKKVMVVPNKPNKKFGERRSAVLTLVSKLPGVLVLSYNNDFKLRVARAKVLSATLIAKNARWRSWSDIPTSDRVFYDKPQNFTMRSFYNRNFIYKLGEDVVPDTFDDDYNVCARGVHGFLSVDNALMYR